MTFKELLKSNRWNYSTMAKKINVCPSVVRKWAIKSCTPSPANIKKLAQVLECTTDEVINALLA